MILPIRPELNIFALSSLFDDMSESYKIYWFQSIMDGVKQGTQNMTFDEIINRMILHAWYPVSEHRLKLGPSDTLEKTVYHVHELSGLSSSAPEKDILTFLLSATDPQLVKYRNTLAMFVPYRLMAPFMPDFKGKCWDNQSKTIRHINENDSTLYTFGDGQGLQRMIRIRDKWMPYLISNQEIIDDWIEYSLVEYLQKRNPNIAGISDKLHAPVECGWDKPQSSGMRYYHIHAAEYCNASSFPMPESYYADFLSLIPEGCRILDLGCGSGRDLKYFAEHGYEAEGLDSSTEMCRFAEQHSERIIHCADCRTWVPEKKYDAIWACASLLHLTEEEIVSFFRNLSRLLNSGGISYASFKQGIQTGEDADGRYFTDFTQDLLSQILEQNTALRLLDQKVTPDRFGRSGFEWINLYFKFM